VPVVAVRVAEHLERRVGAPLRIGTARPDVGVEAVVTALGVVEHPGRLHTVGDEFVVRRLDVGNDEEALS
jgi:hypothetical protein